MHPLWLQPARHNERAQCAGDLRHAAARLEIRPPGQAAGRRAVCCFEDLRSDSGSVRRWWLWRLLHYFARIRLESQNIVLKWGSGSIGGGAGEPINRKVIEMAFVVPKSSHQQPSFGNSLLGADFTSRPGGLFGLGFSPPPPPPPLSAVQLSGLFGALSQPRKQAVSLGVRTLELDGLRYSFNAYGIDEVVHAFNAVYAFATPFGRVIYIGRAQLLSARVNGSHEKLARAKAQGATELWVCVPSVNDAVDYCEAERRLIRGYCPPLNDQYNPLSRL